MRRLRALSTLPGPRGRAAPKGEARVRPTVLSHLPPKHELGNSFSGTARRAGSPNRIRPAREGMKFRANSLRRPLAPQGRINRCVALEPKSLQERNCSPSGTDKCWRLVPNDVSAGGGFGENPLGRLTRKGDKSPWVERFSGAISTFARFPHLKIFPVGLTPCLRTVTTALPKLSNHLSLGQPGK